MKDPSALITFILSILLGHGTVAQQWQVFDIATANFPSNTVVDVVKDGQGAIWAATNWGLCRYADGSWSFFQEDNSGLPNNNISCLAVDSLDRIWVGTVTAGIGVFDGSDWTYLDGSNSPIVTEGVRSITHDHRGWVWIGTELGLHCWTGAEWRLYNDTPQSYNGYELFGNNIGRTAVNAQGLVAIATRNAGLVYISDDDFVYYTAAGSNLPDNSSSEIAYDSNGDRWLACPSGGLVRHAGPYDDVLWFQYTAASVGFLNNTLNCIAIGANDIKVVGTETWGLLFFQNPGNWWSLDTENSGLPDNDVLKVLIDDQGVIWAATALGGLARFDPATSLEEHLYPTAALAIYPNPFQDRVSVDLQLFDGTVEWSLVDALGRSVAAGRVFGGSTVVLELGHQHPGTYFLRSSSLERTRVGSLISR